jgi:Asp-tRNA(Asn)/Glu-tRNA(Gln) amidotransferase B subunit
MTSKQVREISDQIQGAKHRYYKAIERAGTGITDPQEIDRVISEVIEANEDVQAVLKRWRELSK